MPEFRSVPAPAGQPLGAALGIVPTARSGRILRYFYKALRDLQGIGRNL